MNEENPMREIALEEMKQLELEIMVDIDAFCRKHGLRYYLAVGTLLGAVRHKALFRGMTISISYPTR